MADNIKKKGQMKKLNKMKDKDLEALYNETNLIISKFKGAVKVGQDLGVHQKHYQHATITRARVLTVMNQRRHERMFRNGDG